MKINRNLLLSLGFIEENVSAEESGTTPFTYFCFKLRNQHCFLITNSDDECVEPDTYSVEFFNEESAGKIVDGENLKNLCDIIKKMI